MPKGFDCTHSAGSGQAHPKETGLIFSTENVPKVLDGTKVVTRRLWGLTAINESPDEWLPPYRIDRDPQIWTFGNRRTLLAVWRT